MTTPTTNTETALAPAVTAAIGPALEVYQRMQTIKSVLAPDLSDQELQLFAMVAERSRLDPFARQIYAIKRQGKLTFQTGIDGFRSSAEETNEYRGSDEPEFGPIVTTGASSAPHPEWCVVVVHREFANGKTLDQSSGKVYFDEFYPGDAQGFQWRKMPRTMLAKCAEAVAFRKAFPKRFGQVYTPEEMEQADAVENARPVGPTARDRVAERRAAIEAAQSNPPDDEGDAVPDGAEDAVEGVFSDVTEEVVVSLTGRLTDAERDSKAGDGPATSEQKKALRDVFASLDPAVLGRLLERAFRIQAGADGKFAVTSAQAQALLDVYAESPDTFAAEAAEEVSR